MKILMWLLLAMMCSSCAKEHNKSSAIVEFLSVKREEGLPLYDISFSSNIDLQDLYGRGEGLGQASTNLNCALENDSDFSVGNTIERSAYGLIEKSAPGHVQGAFNYVTRAFLSETRNKGTSRRNLSVDELNSILANKTDIPCKVVITAYGYKPYYSNTMHIPTADLLREINKPRSK
ncbi:hypothetical protein AM274_28370 [Pseudomonas nunensis]|nr:hypothetical protein AM274_28370 [Pseudomonas nunensis]